MQKRSRGALNENRKQYEQRSHASTLTHILLPQIPLMLHPIRRHVYFSACYCIIRRAYSLHWIQQYASDPNISRHASLAAIHVLDAMRHLVSVNEWVDERLLDFSTISSAIMQHPSLPMTIQNLSYFSPLAAVSEPLPHLLSKCIKQRCQNRTPNPLIRKFLISRQILTTHRKANTSKQTTILYDTQVFQICKQITLCVLLGNFPCSELASMRPTSLHVRKQLYHIFQESLQCDRWVLRLFHHCWPVLINCLRYYVIYAIENNPSLEETVGSLLKLKEWKVMLEKKVLAPLLQYFDTNLQIPSSDLCRSFATLPQTPCSPAQLWNCGSAKRCLSHPCPHGKLRSSHSAHEEQQKLQRAKADEEASNWSWELQPFEAELNSLLSRAEIEQGTISYSRGHKTPMDSLRPLLSKSVSDTKHYAALVPFPSAVKMEPHPEEEEEEEEEEGDDEEERERKKKKKKKKKATAAFSCTFHPKVLNPYLPPHQLQSLCTVISQIGPLHEGALQRAISFFTFFGVHPDHQAYLQKLLALYLHGGTTLEHINNIFVTLQAQLPHEYNLLQISAHLIQSCQRRMRFYMLPYHIMAAQIDTIKLLSRELAGGGGGGSGEEISLLVNKLSFVYCGVCGQIYSMIQDPCSAYKNCYQYGLRDASRDQLTGKIYCARKKPKTNHKGTCGEKELLQIPMIGRLLWFRLRMIMICPQKGCGQLFAFDSKNTEYVHYTERGPSCMRCSLRLSATPRALERLEIRYSTINGVECSLCQLPIQHPKQQASIFPYDKHLCHRHKSSIRDILMDNVEKNPAATEDTITAWIDDLRDREQAIIENLQQTRDEEAYSHYRSHRTMQSLQQTEGGGETRIARKKMR